MNINIKGTHIELNEEITDYAEKKVTSCEKFLATDDNVIVCDVELAQTRNQKNGPIYYAEVNLETTGNMYRATAEEESFEAAIDKVKDELSKEIRRNKTKKMAAIKKGGAKAKAMLKMM